MDIISEIRKIKNQHTIVKAWKTNSKGVEVFDGWDIFRGDIWCTRLKTKREAKALLDEVRVVLAKEYIESIKNEN